SDKSLKRFQIKNRKLTVAGLNHHGDQGRQYDREEAEEITASTKAAQEAGIDVAGRVPAVSDGFHALDADYDAVLSLYHDQGHIAAKMTDFHKTISSTNGLPFLRTSVDHGTAFDIAGKNIAESISMEECIKLAAEYAPKFTKHTME